MILVTCAVGKELAFLRPQPHVELLVTGVGPVEAAAAVSRALAQSTYDLVVSAGIGGAFEGMAEIGEGLVVADEMLELDLETGAPIALPDGAAIVNRATSDLTLVDRLVELGYRAVRGITVHRVTATDGSAARLAAFGVGIETMEGFAVLRAAEIAGVPAVEVRGISNIVCDRKNSRWDFSAGVQGVQQILTALLSLVAPA
ncbi:MAG TPA: futalosine hydrolase [Candidatus Baltobacteraceae bacterium]|nr:futalosine hydrolase [Candidatus Baltobacteraceae bacterium]